MKSSLRIILFVAFVDLIGFGLIIPLQAVYAKRLHASALVFGCLVGIYALAQIIFNPILGQWSDRIGRRPILMLSVAGSVASHVLLGVADLAHSLPLLFAARALDGITGANIATVQAYIADVTTKDDRAKGMGLFGAAFGAGFVVGPALAAGLSALGHWVLHGSEAATSWPAFGAATISFIALLLVWRKLPEPERHKEHAPPSVTILAHWREIATTTQLKELLVSFFGVTTAIVMLEVTFVFLCADRFHWRERGIGMIFAYFGVLMVIVQGGMVGRLAKKYGEGRVLGVAPLLTAAGFLMLSFVASAQAQWFAWFLLLVGCVPTAVGHGLTGPNINSLISKAVSESRQGGTFGASQAVGSLARAVAPPIGGLLYDWGPAIPYWFGAVVLVAVAVLLWAVKRSTSPQTS